MATIIHGAAYTLTNEAAEMMVEDKIIYRCHDEIEHNGMMPSDFPIYHLTAKVAGRGIGAGNIIARIRDAEKEVEACR